MKLKYFLIMCCFCCFTITAKAEDKVFAGTVYKVINAFKNADEELLNSLIHPKQGIYIFYSPGGYLSYSHESSIDIGLIFNTNSHYGAALLSWGKIYGPLQLKTKRLGAIEGYCEANFAEDYIEEPGIYASRLGVDHPFYEYFEKMYTPEEPSDAAASIPEDIIKEVKELDSKTRKVIIYTDIYNQGSPLSFYVSLIDGKWYLTVLDGTFCYNSTCEWPRFYGVDEEVEGI